MTLTNHRATAMIKTQVDASTSAAGIVPDSRARAPSSRRRALLLAGGLTAAGVGGVAAYAVTQYDHAIADPAFADIATAMRTLDRLRTQALHASSGWDLAHVLHHAAQSIDYSIEGYPQPKPAWFRGTVGSAAFAMFSVRGRMSHGLAEPIPGAPDIAAGQDLVAAVERVTQSLHRFERHAGPLAPHFAYGELTKVQYARAHLMHLANHWDLVEKS
jgi:hypothetical protein